MGYKVEVIRNNQVVAVHDVKAGDNIIDAYTTDTIRTKTSVTNRGNVPINLTYSLDIDGTLFGYYANNAVLDPGQSLVDIIIDLTNLQPGQRQVLATAVADSNFGSAADTVSFTLNLTEPSVSVSIDDVLELGILGLGAIVGLGSIYLLVNGIQNENR